MKPYRVMEVGRGAVEHLVRAHYLHKWPGVNVAILALMDGSDPIGTVVFSLPPRETPKRYGVSVAWELARLFIQDTTPKNTETWFVARCIRWVREHHPEVDLLISYADPGANHEGVIYKAGNWIADGRTDDERKTARHDYACEVEQHGLFMSGPTIVKLSRWSHLPEGKDRIWIRRASKFRFIYWMDGKHEKRRKASRA